MFFFSENISVNFQSRSAVGLAFEYNVTIAIAVSVANSGDVYVVWLVFE